ncbi:MAG: DNA primase [Thiotrichaceae bacterium]|nr:DNA primase [Thiotrichaceae bacterium]
MAGIIPRQFVDELLTKVDVVEVINSRLPLKKKGHEYTACCPFHSEKTPSFSVSPSKQFYHCFGCGVNGSAISFLMEYEHYDFIEAVEQLASDIGLEVPREQGKLVDPKKIERQKDHYELLEAVAQFYQQHLQVSDIAKDYLQQRDLSSNVASHFGLGFIPEGWDLLSQRFVPEYTAQQLIDTGLLIEKDEGGAYDRFRDRIMFPIRDTRGRVIGFGGRVLGDGMPKYLNSPETEIFHKGMELYGLYEARKASRKLTRIIVVEGYMDVIALAQFDINNAVATLGTATTKDHIRQIFRTVDEVVFCFDGDRAGRDAAWKALKNVIPEVRDGKEIYFNFLPDGEDPDSQVRKIGKNLFNQSLSEASISLTDYLIQHLQENYNLSSREGSVRFIDEVIKLLAHLSEGLIKDQLLDEVSRLTSIKVDVIRKKMLTNDAPQVQNFSQQGSQAVRLSPVRYAASLLLHDTSLVAAVEDSEQISQTGIKGADFLATLIETIEENPNINGAGIVERWRGTAYEIACLDLMKWQPSFQDQTMLKNEFMGCLQNIIEKSRQQRLECLLQKARNESLDAMEKKDLLTLLSQ